MALTPVTYGATNRPPRGDYSVAREDYTCDQAWDRYTPQQHALYARLYARHRLADRGGARPDSRGRVLPAAGTPPLPGHRLAAHSGGVRLHRGARPVPRPVRPRSSAVRPH